MFASIAKAAMPARSYFLSAFGILLTTLLVLGDTSSVRGEVKIRPVQATSPDKDCTGIGMSFADFVQTHKRTYVVGSKEYHERKALFEERVAGVQSHNCKPGNALWKAGLNFLSDRMDSELDRLRGRKGGGSDSGQPMGGGDHVARERLATLERTDGHIGERGEVMKSSGLEAPSMPMSFGWSNLQAMKQIVDQGGCGSCWASATIKMLEAHTEIYSKPESLSLQQLVSCTPNPEQCGGNGGCNGSTGELALDYVMHNGLLSESALAYSASDVVCPANMKAKNANPVPQPNASSFLAIRQLAPAAYPAQRFGMFGWRKLPANELSPLYAALYQEGPIAVSIVASNSWNAYSSGIMNNCSATDVVVNHLVVLIGYGVDDQAQNTKYWQIQNSWGPEWGEGGHIRLIRQDNDTAEKGFCGMDNDPSVGTGCKGGPSQVWVCGSCGILYDNVVPHFQGSTAMAQEMMRRRSQTYAPP